MSVFLFGNRPRQARLVRMGWLMLAGLCVGVLVTFFSVQAYLEQGGKLASGSGPEPCCCRWRWCSPSWPSGPSAGRGPGALGGPHPLGAGAQLDHFQVRGLPSAMAKRSAVRTLWKPCRPAAPGFMYRHFSRSSHCTRQMCECPQMKSPGVLA